MSGWKNGKIMEWHSLLFGLIFNMEKKEINSTARRKTDAALEGKELKRGKKNKKLRLGNE